MDTEAQEGIQRDLEICILFGSPFFGLGSVEKRLAGHSSADSLIGQVFIQYLTLKYLLVIEYHR